MVDFVLSSERNVLKHFDFKLSTSERNGSLSYSRTQEYTEDDIQVGLMHWMVQFQNHDCALSAEPRYFDADARLEPPTGRYPTLLPRIGPINPPSTLKSTFGWGCPGRESNPVCSRGRRTFYERAECPSTIRLSEGWDHMKWREVTFNGAVDVAMQPLGTAK